MVTIDMQERMSRDISSVVKMLFNNLRYNNEIKSVQNYSDKSSTKSEVS